LEKVGFVIDARSQLAPGPEGLFAMRARDFDVVGQFDAR